MIVDRTSKLWGNPFVVSENTDAERAIAVGYYRDYINHPYSASFREKIRQELRGKDLCCWCPLDQPCHADVLLEIANGDNHDR